jgi:signal transduction histidine kinase
LTKGAKIWLAAVAIGLFAIVIAALILPRSFLLNAFSDIIQTLLLASGTLAFIPLARQARGRLRLFWSLNSLGIGFWFSYQLLWTFYEVVLRRPVPDLFDGDIILFVHIVPFMAALALRPHVPRDEYAARLGRLDFGLLIVWWFYLYFLTVTPWQYVIPDAAAYGSNLNAVYLAEKIAFLTALLACCHRSSGEWRVFYANFFGVGVCYSASSYIANWAIAHKLYYSGSAYDIPLAAAMAWLTFIGLRSKVQEPEEDSSRVSTSYGVWVARASMIAVFSLPLFAVWALANDAIPPRIRLFRVELTLLSALVMGIMIFVRQRLLDRELIRLLNRSQESFENLKRLQAQIVQSEKVASVGQLVGGAAHELNNPITAMLGYSDLLLSTSLTSEQQSLAAKIGQHVRRAKSLVASLISFARQSPASKAAIDLNALVRTAVKLLEVQSQALDIELGSQIEPNLPRIWGDSNQLLQVCMQLVASCLHDLSDSSGRILVVTGQRGDTIVLEVSTEVAVSHEGAQRDSKEGDLALSACQGILQEHRGHVSRQHRNDGALLLRVELPALENTAAKPRESSLPALWQSRPFA